MALTDICFRLCLPFQKLQALHIPYTLFTYTLYIHILKHKTRRYSDRMRKKAYKYRSDTAIGIPASDWLKRVGKKPIRFSGMTWADWWKMHCLQWLKPKINHESQRLGSLWDINNKSVNSWNQNGSSSNRWLPLELRDQNTTNKFTLGFSGIFWGWWTLCKKVIFWRIKCHCVVKRMLVMQKPERWRILIPRLIMVVYG